MVKKRIYQTYAFKKYSPVYRREEAHARNDIADRYLRRCLRLIFGFHSLLDARTSSLQFICQPFVGGGNCEVLVAQLAGKPLNKGGFKFLALVQAFDN